MPEITKEIFKLQLNAKNLFALSSEVLKDMNAENIQEEIITENPFSGSIKSFVKSIWGWGGMDLKIHISENNDLSKLVITGYIAQLATGPLKKMINSFLQILKNKAHDKYGLNLNIETSNKNFFSKLKKTDIIMILTVVMGIIFLTALGVLRIPGGLLIIGFIIIPFVYYLIRKKKNVEK